MFIRLLFAYSKSTAAYYSNCRSTFSVANKFMISTTNVIPLMVAAMCMAENVQNIYSKTTAAALDSWWAH